MLLNRKLITVIFISVFGIQVSPLLSQTLFNSLPDPGGLDGASRAKLVIAERDYIYVIGDHIDSTIVGFEPGIWPHRLKMDYEGNLLDVEKLIDSAYYEHFSIYKFPLLHKRNSIYYYYAFRNQPNKTYSDSYLIELDLNSGNVLRSAVIDHPDSLDVPHRQDVALYNNSEIILVHDIQINQKVDLDVLIVDTLFEVIDRFTISDNGRSNFPKWIESVNGKFILTGISFIRHNGSITGESNLFYMITDSTGTIEDYKLLNTPHNWTSLADTDTWHREPDGSWVTSYIDAIPIDDCANCYINKPYILKISPDFDSVLWITRFQGFTLEEPRLVHLGSMTASKDGSGYVTIGEFRDTTAFGIAFKASPNGDSLWFRRYLPLDFEEGRALWIQIGDIQSTPYNTFVMTATLGDADLQIVRSWVLHVDSEGCLIPGCGTTAIDESDIEDLVLFRFHPNPVQSELYILSRVTASQDYTLALHDINGRLHKTTTFSPLEGAQYIVNVGSIAQGNYIVSIINIAGEIVGSFKFYKV